MSTGLSAQRGVALLTVLLVVAMMALLVAELTFGFRHQIRTVSSGQNMDQARWYARSAEELAIQVLEQTFEDDDKVIHAGQAWARSGMIFPVEQGQIAGEITDARSCFNINALAVDDMTKEQATYPLEVFISLMEVLEVDTFRAQRIARASRDWVYSGQKDVQYGDSTYLARPMPYLAGRAPMRDISEWRAVDGVNAEIARTIMPYLCALPEDDLLLNVNTLTKEKPALLAAAFIGQLSLEQAEDILARRPSDGWETVSEFLLEARPSEEINGAVSLILTTESKYFQVKARVRYLDAEAGLVSLLQRKDKESLQVISRKYGAAF
ncbi:type II secretion system minor pseudopilin GspK [Parendozoicomonas haliclonae]|uniref:Type II secretion system protein K n=1 Tax=Parendozoicomonas haliclonae TaxID=1960125 RepID=A0A1X7AH89_9GAMM|nr:type II secretion system minor pseudopilin GspK [Parendozoicomonas haliclonae]SMA39988.1 putative type II secretion system protein K [Parendozoicomonas haliclonae]